MGEAQDCIPQKGGAMTISFFMKAAGCTMVVMGTSGYGAFLAGNYRNRLVLLEQLRQMIFLLKGQIIYANAQLPEAFEAVGQRTKGELAELFMQVAERLNGQQGEPFFQIWQEEIKKLSGSKGFTKEDRQCLTALGEHLGFLDRDMQERNLLLYLEQLDLTIGGLRSHKEERCRLYTSLGVMGGLFLAVMLL